MLEVKRKGFPEILPDNEEMYFSMVIGAINSVDELSSLQVNNTLKGWQFRLSPSVPKYTTPIIEEILKLHNYLGIHLDISKSIKTSGVISFVINKT